MSEQNITKMKYVELNPEVSQEMQGKKIQFTRKLGEKEQYKGQLQENQQKASKYFWKVIFFIISFLVMQFAVIMIYITIIPPNQKLIVKQIEKQVQKQVVKQIVKEKQYVNKVAKIFPATQKLQYDYSKEIQPVTAVFTSSGRRYKLFEETLRSFFTNNTYPIRQILVVDDDIFNEQFEKFMAKYPNITFMSTNLKVGQFYAVDLIYKYIKTEYYFHSEEDFLFILPGFIQKSMQIMLKDPKISQVVLRDWGNVTQGPPHILDPKKTEFSAFSFNPSLKRMHEYRIFEQKFGGYSEFISFKSFGKGAGNTEVCISIYLISQGYKGYTLGKEYAQHNGWKNGLSKFVFDKNFNCKLIIPAF